MDLRQNLTPALLAYDGIQYTYMAPAVIEKKKNGLVEASIDVCKQNDELLLTAVTEAIVKCRLNTIIYKFTDMTYKYNI